MKLILSFFSGPNVSLKIEINPASPRTFPQMMWLGSETAVVSFRDKVADRMDSWEPGHSISVNLEQILDLTLPHKETIDQTAEELEVTCCICYSHRLNGEVPSKVCDNTQCGQSFHTYCLYEVRKWCGCVLN
jgi:E3 ubiquitin-protein ligase FANCL